MLHNVKLLHKRTVVQLILITLLLSCVILPTPIPSAVPDTEAQIVDCTVPKDYSFSNRVYYLWTANTDIANSSCWTVTATRVAVVDTNTCGWTEKSFEFYTSGTASQTFTIPLDLEDAHKPSFSLQYTLDFIDPHDDPAWNVFEMKVVDTTTGSILATERFDGSMGDLYCSNRGFSWNQDLAGHTIQVRFKGSRGYNDTFIRLRDVYLFQRRF